MCTGFQKCWFDDFEIQIPIQTGKPFNFGNSPSVVEIFIIQTKLHSDDLIYCYIENTGDFKCLKCLLKKKVPLILNTTRIPEL